MYPDHKDSVQEYGIIAAALCRCKPPKKRESETISRWSV